MLIIKKHLTAELCNKLIQCLTIAATEHKQETGYIYIYVCVYNMNGS